MHLLRWIVLPALLFCASCSVRVRTAPERGVQAPELAPMDYTVQQWVESKVCSTYFLYLRFRENREADNVPGKRVGELAKGSILGGGAPDPDSADALYGAMVQFPTASFLLVPRYNIQSSGVIPIGTRPLFGRRCSLASARGVEVGPRPAPVK